MKKINSTIILSVFFTLMQVFSYAQNQVIKGKVTGADRNPLAGVSVWVKENPGTGTKTNEQGEFSISATGNAKTLICSAVGFAKKEVAITGNTLNISMDEASSQLDELVVVGYGKQSKRDLTGAISGVKAKDIENLPLSTVEQALQGRASGVFINSGSGKLGQGINIRIRGISSISASSQPLFVIDGQPVIATSLGGNTEPDNPLSSIDPNDVLSMEVLKDASATAIYGARAANGVILITTKSGQTGKTKVDFSYYTGISTPTHLKQFLNANQYQQLYAEAFKNSANFGTKYNSAAEAWDYYEGTNDWVSPANSDWSKQAFQTGNINNYGLSFSGGDAKTKFFISGNYNDQKGIIIYNKMNRANLRANLEHQVSDKFRLGVNLNLNRLMNYRVSSDNSFSNPVQLNALPPIQPIRDADGTFNRGTIYTNVLNDAAESKNNALSYRVLGNFFAQYDFTKSFYARTEIAGDMVTYEEDQYSGRNTSAGAPAGLGYSSFTRAQSYNTNNTLNWQPKIGEAHQLEVLLGNSFQSSQTNRTSVEGKGFPNDQFQKIANAAVISSGSSTQTGYAFLSFFSRANYKYKNRYLFGASIRYDGSSRFGVDHRFGWFPSVSGGWVLSEEDFLKGNNTLNFLKLRASYGSTGNAEIGDFSSRTLYTGVKYADQFGIVPSQVGDSHLNWEKTNQFDVGLNFSLFKNRITAEIDYFDKQTNGLLLDFPLPGTNGYSIITKNLGSLYNRGWEFSLTTNNLVGAFQWSTTFNISTYKNKVLNMNGSVITGGTRQVGRVSEGMPYGYFYGPKYAGVNPANGNAQYYNANGKAVDQDDFDGYEQVIGDPNPKFYGGLGNKFSYKNFDLDIQTQFVYGNNLYNIGGIFQSSNGRYLDNQTVDQMNYWTPTNTNTNIPQPRYRASNGDIRSSRWVEDGSYLRVKNVMLGYNIPKNTLSKIKIQNARIYVAAQNLFTLTKYTGYDPEVNTTFTGGVNLGHDFYTPPQAKTITVGINLGF